MKTVLQLHSSEVETAPQVHILLWLWSGPAVYMKCVTANSKINVGVIVIVPYKNLEYIFHGLFSYSYFCLKSLDFSISFSELLLNFGNPCIRFCLQTQRYDTSVQNPSMPAASSQTDL